MSQLLGIPVPSADQIIVGAELVFILIPARALARRASIILDNDARRLRDYVIKHHVKSGHDDRLYACEAGFCPSLRSSERPPELLEQLQPEIELDLL